MNNFNMQKIIRGTGATSSMLDGLAIRADNNDYNDYVDLAAQTNLIYNYDWDSNNYHDMLVNNPRTEEDLNNSDFNPDNLENFRHDQRRTISQKGSQDEYTIAFAANFNHKVYLGATIGIQDIYYKETSRFVENNVDYENNSFEYQLNDYGTESYLKTTGTGVNFKIGAIFKPVDALRLGVAFHSPTYYDLHDSFDNYMYSNIAVNGQNNFSDADSWGEYDYRIESPMRGILSAAYIIGKAGLISVDYEYVDYSTIKLRDGGDGYDFYDENQEIKEVYKAVGNLRVGAEYRLNNFFSLRGGYEYLPSPYEKYAFDMKQFNGNEDTQTYSVGFGIKSGGVFFDLAYKHIANTNYLELYQVPSGVQTGTSPTAKLDYQTDNVTFTLGFRF
jgi:long-subunit fatty acid transport protein